MRLTYVESMIFMDFVNVYICLGGFVPDVVIVRTGFKRMFRNMIRSFTTRNIHGGLGSWNFFRHLHEKASILATLLTGREKLGSMIARDFNGNAGKKWQAGSVSAWRHPRSCSVRSYQSPAYFDNRAR